VRVDVLASGQLSRGCSHGIAPRRSLLGHVVHSLPHGNPTVDTEIDHNSTSQQQTSIVLESMVFIVISTRK
jgi:hypothetical protein